MRLKIQFRFGLQQRATYVVVVAPHCGPMGTKKGGFRIIYPSFDSMTAEVVMELARSEAAPLSLTIDLSVTCTTHVCKFVDLA